MFSLKVEEACLGCRQTESGNPLELKTCSRCKVAKYCSVDCQKKNYVEHKVDCRTIKKLTKQVDELSEDLRNCTLSRSRIPVDVFKNHAGHFWEIQETRDYCQARMNLAVEIYITGVKSGSKSILEVALGHYLELLRLNHNDNMGIRLSVPFLLMELDRDEDAYNFIKWWVMVYNSAQVPPSREGEWIYLTNQNIFEDLLSCNPACRRPLNDMNVHFLVALALIKARILLQAKNEMKDQGHLYFLRATKETMEQLHHFGKYMHKIKRKNRYVLKGIAKPSLLVNMTPPGSIETGDLSEAYYVLLRSQRLFESNPIAMNYIRDLYMFTTCSFSV